MILGKIQHVVERTIAHIKSWKILAHDADDLSTPSKKPSQHPSPIHLHQSLNYFKDRLFVVARQSQPSSMITRLDSYLRLPILTVYLVSVTLLVGHFVFGGQESAKSVVNAFFART